eukprot:14830737-Alexandrium_andersonii.AAC.1
MPGRARSTSTPPTPSRRMGGWRSGSSAISAGSAPRLRLRWTQRRLLAGALSASHAGGRQGHGEPQQAGPRAAAAGCQGCPGTVGAACRAGCAGAG